MGGGNLQLQATCTLFSRSFALCEPAGAFCTFCFELCVPQVHFASTYSDVFDVAFSKAVSKPRLSKAKVAADEDKQVH